MTANRPPYLTLRQALAIITAQTATLREGTALPDTDSLTVWNHLNDAIGLIQNAQAQLMEDYK